MPSRRAFLATLPAAVLAPLALTGSVAGRAPRLRILMLGGTNYVGPHLVSTALERGHEVTLFNRGITSRAGLTRHAGARNYVGDRYSPPGGSRWPTASSTS